MSAPARSGAQPKAAVLQFPGTNGDRDMAESFAAVGFAPVMVDSREHVPADAKVVGVPGGFAYGDYWRAGMLARYAPAVRDLPDFVARGGLIIGICNGFQILVEAGLLPGGLTYNDPPGFRHRWVNVDVKEHTVASPWLSQLKVGQRLRWPMAHGEGNYFHPEGMSAIAERVPLVYERNVNGAIGKTAALLDTTGRVLGVMPHPDRAIDPHIGSTDGLAIFAGARGAVKPALRQQGLAFGLKAHELDHIEAELGREPRLPELAVFAGMWSEHCSYKSSKPRLAQMPREAPCVLAGPGSHAGAVDVGEGWAVAFKIESHNHPSAVEPYQGAATGVGGILRDVIAQGARPCLVMDSLCFGSLADARTQHIASGVVAGIAGYGNAIGLPNVGGKTVYDERYDGNPLVNALAAGLVRHDGMRTATAAGLGNAVLYAGASTGRDGILGAAFASEELSNDTTEKRSHVQVGDPFTGRKLMEACLSFGPEHGLVACQDMGACGLTCAASEMAALGGVGIDLDLDTVPLREAGMAPEEILVSESQERFLFVVEAKRAAEAVKHFEHYGVHAAVVGRVTSSGQFRALWHGETVVDLPAKLITDGTPKLNWPEADIPSAPAYMSFGGSKSLSAPLLKMLTLPGIADLTELVDRYDHTVGNRTVRGPAEAESAVMKLPASSRGFALTITGRGELCAVDAYRGALSALGEATRNLACVGAPIMAITDGLNNGPPSDPVENKRLSETIRGLADGLKQLEIPVTGGNVSLYNATSAGAIPPTPMVGAIGVVDDVGTVPRGALASGLTLLLLGTLSDDPSTSVYGRIATGMTIGGEVAVDLAADRKLAGVLVAAIRQGLVAFAKDAGAGGLLVALAKACVRGRMGASVALPKAGRADWQLFGEISGTAWVGVLPEHADKVLELASTAGLAAASVGTTGGKALRVTVANSSVVDVSLEKLRTAFSGERGN